VTSAINVSCRDQRHQRFEPEGIQELEERTPGNGVGTPDPGVHQYADRDLGDGPSLLVLDGKRFPARH